MQLEAETEIWKSNVKNFDNIICFSQTHVLCTVILHGSTNHKSNYWKDIMFQFGQMKHDIIFQQI